MIQKLVDAWRVMRPRSVVHLHKGIDDLRRELARAQAALRETQANVGQLERREAQLRAILRRDIELENRSAGLGSLLRDHEVAAHVAERFAAASLQTHPFPHVVVDRVLPGRLYESLIEGLPPVELFYDRRPNKRQLTVPFDLAPSYGRRVWDYVASTVVPTMFVPAIVEKFREPLVEWLRASFPALGAEPLAELPLKASDGRILLRTRGYVIPPHRDPKWGFVTGLLYLARPGDSEAWGTQLYAVEGDEEARGVAPHWIDPKRCRQVADVTFVPNRMLVFLNSVGAHGARIPDDALPEDLERYAYQFRVGAGEDARRAALAALDAGRRPLWSGRPTDY